MSICTGILTTDGFQWSKLSLHEVSKPLNIHSDLGELIPTPSSSAAVAASYPVICVQR